MKKKGIWSGGSLSEAEVSRIGALFLGQDEPGAPGGALAVMERGEVVLRYCFGLASVEHGVAIEPQTCFHVVSLTKMFTAAALVLLEAQGRVSLDDDIRRFIPELADGLFEGGAISVRHLLSMTSGLRDGLEIMRLRGVWRPSAQRERDLLELAYRQDQLSFPVGTRFVYTNTNFVLLAELIRRITGMDADEYRKMAIYDPLGMTATLKRDSDEYVVPHLATPYIPTADGGFCRGTNLLGISGDVLVTNLQDMIKWLAALREGPSASSGTVGGVAITKQLAEPMRLADESPTYYGLGLAIREYRGLPVLSHTGSQPGYKAHLAYIPERDFGFVMLSNREDSAPSRRMIEIAEILLEGRFPEAHPAQKILHGARSFTARSFTAFRMTSMTDKCGGSIEQAPSAADNSLDGIYVAPDSGEVITLTQHEHTIQGDALGVPLTLYPQGKGVFTDGGDYKATMPVTLSFEWGAAPSDVTCRVNLGGFKATFKRQPAITLTRQQLSAFVGRYESDEMATVHLISLAPSGTLTIQYGTGFDRALTFEMTPIAHDLFLVRPTAPGISYQHLFRFQRNQAGEVIAALVSMARLKNVRLIRRG
ncbi:MAG: serine hydrolase domain-containing protein [Ardenticatenaceae bacterium]